MASRYATILPAPMEEQDKIAKLIVTWVKRKIKQRDFSSIVTGLIPQIFCVDESDKRGNLLRYAVEWLIECDEHDLALSLLQRYPVDDEGLNETESVGTLLLFLACKSEDPAHLEATHAFVRKHEENLREMDAVDLFMNLAEVSRDQDDLLRVQRQLDRMADGNDLPFLLRMAEINHNEVVIERICRRARYLPPDDAEMLLKRLTVLIAKLPKDKARKIIILLPSADARSAAEHLQDTFDTN